MNESVTGLPVELRAVKKSYGNLLALNGIDLDVKPGEILGLLGHNGAGKTTTMKLILGVIHATTGTVKLFGESPVGGNADKLRRSLGYLPENVSFYEQLSGREVLDYFAQLKGANIRANTALLERVGLDKAANRRVKTYSKGMRQRLGLAQALLGEPKLLLLDEPTAGLDPSATGEFYEMLDGLRKQGTSIMLSSHILPGIERYVDRVAILGGGKLLDIGSIKELNERVQLPLTFHLRGSWGELNWEEKLAAHPVEFKHINGQRLEFSCMADAKIELMRLLLNETSVEDVEVVQPSLDELYAYYNRPAQTEVSR